MSVESAVRSTRTRSGQRWWGRAALTLFPLALRPLGYTFRVGQSPTLSDDARRVLEAVGGPDDSEPHRRYLESAAWVVGYRHGAPIACMGLYDTRVLSFTLNHIRSAPPHGMDPATYRDLSRLAIVPAERGGSHFVMLALLCKMSVWCQENGITHLLTISVPALFAVYQRYNPSAEQITLEPAAAPPSEEVQAYHDRIAARIGPVISYTFDMNGFDALGSMLRAILQPVRRAVRRLRRAA